MTVEKEEIDRPPATGGCEVLRAIRAKSGQWTVEFELNYRVKLPNGQELVIVDRHQLVRAQLSGRRVRSVTAPKLEWAKPGEK